MGFFEELKTIVKQKYPHYDERPSSDNYLHPLQMGRQEGMDATIEALKEMMLGEPIKARATWGAGYNITHLWGVKQLGNILGLEDGKGEWVYVIVVRKERQDDISGTDVQVLPGAEEEAGQGV